MYIIPTAVSQVAFNRLKTKKTFQKHKINPSSKAPERQKNDTLPIEFFSRILVVHYHFNDALIPLSSAFITRHINKICEEMPFTVEEKKCVIFFSMQNKS